MCMCRGSSTSAPTPSIPPVSFVQPELKAKNTLELIEREDSLNELMSKVCWIYLWRTERIGVEREEKGSTERQKGNK